MLVKGETRFMVMVGGVFMVTVRAMVTATTAGCMRQLHQVVTATAMATATVTTAVMTARGDEGQGTCEHGLTALADVCGGAAWDPTRGPCTTNQISSRAGGSGGRCAPQGEGQGEDGAGEGREQESCGACVRPSRSTH